MPRRSSSSASTALRRSWLAHDFDEYVLVIAGRCVVILGSERIELRAGHEIVIPKGTRQSMAVAAGTRTMHVFGGKPTSWGASRASPPRS